MRYYIEEKDGDRAAGFVTNCHPQDGRQLNNVIQFGFTGQNNLNAFNLMRAADREGDGHRRAKALRVFDFFVRTAERSPFGLIPGYYNADTRQFGSWWTGLILPLAYADWFRGQDLRVSPQERTLLLVDDSAFFRNMLAPVLKAAGYKVRVAVNAQEGLAALRSNHTYDVVLTDIEMPDMNGFEFAETIRADSNLSTMPIIALSSLVSPAAIERGRQAGFHDYVAKFDRPGLIAALKEQTAETRNAA